MKAFKNANVYVEGKGIVNTNLTFDKTIISTTELYDNCEVMIKLLFLQLNFMIIAKLFHFHKMP